MRQIKPQIEQLVKKVVEGLGYELVDVEMTAGRKPTLSVFIYNPDGVTVNICRQVSRRLSDELDIEDLIPNEYFLMVSSPGLERPLKTKRDFERNFGEIIKFKLNEGTDETGTLNAIKEVENEILLSIEKKNNKFIDIKLSNVKKGLIQIKP